MHEWVHEARRTWNSVRAARLKKHVVVDLCGVSFVDRAGEQLLEEMSVAGAILIGSSPMIRSMIDEIKARIPARPGRKKPVGLLTVLFLSLLFAALAVGYGLVSGQTNWDTPVAVHVENN